MSAPAVARADATDVEGIEKKVVEAEKKVEKAETKVEKAKEEVAAAEKKFAAAEKKVAAAKEEVAAAGTDIELKATANSLLKVALEGLQTAQDGVKSAQDGVKSAQAVLVDANDGLIAANKLARQASQRLLDTTSGAASGAQAASGQGAEGGTHVSGGQGDNQELLSVLHEMREEIRNVRQRIDHDDTSEAISQYPVEKYECLLQELQLSLLVVEAPDEAPQSGSGSTSLYTWDERTEPQQSEDCISFLKGHLKFPCSCVLRAIDKRADFLSVRASALGTTMGIKGTSDLAVLDSDLANALVPRAGIILLFELKKEIQERDVRQAQLQTISANRVSQFRPVVVLTDLRESWRYYWIKDRSLCMMLARSASQAWDILNALLASHSAPQIHVSAVLSQDLINRTQLAVTQKPANVSSQHENDDYQMDLLTQEEQEEAERKHVMLFAAEHISWMMYS